MNTVDRRCVLRAGLGAAAAGALAARARGVSAPALVSPSGSAVAAADRERAGTGSTRAVRLVAAPARVELGAGIVADTWSTAMWHPMHLHGHTFRLGASGPRKDTAVVLPRTTVSVALDTDNPGRWMLHCHNAYHAEAGMTALLAYLG
ncbi:multicopper oxidase domain-containing protein [Streptomyces sp. NPDC102395]|uniref:multicopper oxidase domain-containing protein n=1 Tax=Streptomyces sp. NPDC102395 TaxID=3366168 RepID=UPI003822DB08